MAHPLVHSDSHRSRRIQQRSLIDTCSALRLIVRYADRHGPRAAAAPGHRRRPLPSL